MNNKLRIIDVSNCYGIRESQNIKNVTIVDRQTNLIFGVNMSGKTSLYKVFRSLSEGSKISNLYSTDQNPHAKLEINGLIYEYNNGWNRICESIYFCDKQFLNSSILTIQRTARLGINIKDLEEARKNKTANIVPSKDLKDFIENLLKVKTQKEVTGYFSDIGIQDFFKQKNEHMNGIIKFESIRKINIEQKLLGDQEYIDAIDMFKQRKINIELIENYIENIDSITKAVISKYVINNETDLEFHNNIYEYLKTTNPGKCPVCLREFDEKYGLDKIKAEIIQAINVYREKNKQLDISNEINILSVGKSATQKNIHQFLKDLKFNIKITDIEEKWYVYKDYLIGLYETSKTYIARRINDKFSILIAEFIKYNELEQEFRRNLHNLKGSKLLENFIALKNMLNSRIISEFDTQLEEETNSLVITMKDTDNVSIDTYHKNNASEGEKAILSLLYFFAYLKTVKKENESPIVFFDDPIDSHDNFNKHMLLDLIINNINELNVTAVIFTHSSDVVRTFKLNYEYQSSFYYISPEILKGIAKLEKDNLHIFEGVFKFFTRIYSKKGNNIHLDMVSMLPVFRDIIEHAKTLNFPVKAKYENLYKKLSNEFIHYSPNGGNLTLIDLFEIYKFELKNFPYNTSDLLPNEEISKMTVDEYTFHRISYKKPEAHNLIETIKYKNILSLYIRRNMEKILYKVVSRNLSGDELIQFKSKFLRNFTITQKQLLIKNEYSSYLLSFNTSIKLDIMAQFNEYKHVVNDFYHQINSYITPILETSSMYLEEICQKLNEISNQLETI